MNERILIVDDETSIAVAVAGLLRPRGYEVVSAQTGAAAMEIIRNKSVGLTLLDMGLGPDNGLDLLPQLRAWKRITFHQRLGLLVFLCVYLQL